MAYSSDPAALHHVAGRLRDGAARLERLLATARRQLGPKVWLGIGAHRLASELAARDHELHGAAARLRTLADELERAVTSVPVGPP